MGKITAAKTPFLIFSSKRLVAKPTTVGPKEQPKSPARASIANIAVPPFGKLSEASEKEPGHITPTEKPHNAQPIKDNAGFLRKVAIVYAIIQATAQAVIYFDKSTLSLIFE